MLSDAIAFRFTEITDLLNGHAKERTGFFWEQSKVDAHFVSLSIINTTQ